MRSLQRVTAFSSDSDAAAPRQTQDYIRPCAICHKFRLFTGFAAGRPPGRPLRYRIQAMNEDSVY